MLALHGRKQWKEDLDARLKAEQKRAPVPPRFQTQTWVEGEGRFSSPQLHVVEQHENGVVLDKYVKSNDSLVDWVNHPTKILVGPHKGRHAVDHAWAQQVIELTKREGYEKGRKKETEAASEKGEDDPPPPYAQ